MGDIADLTQASVLSGFVVKYSVSSHVSSDLQIAIIKICSFFRSGFIELREQRSATLDHIFSP